MTMQPLIRGLMALIAALAAIAGGSAARAAVSCGVTGNGSAATSVYYNPFDPNPLSQVSVPLTLTRKVDTGGKKTQQVFFIIVKPVGSPNYTITARAPGGTTYTNIAYYDGATNGLPKSQSNTPGQIYWNFGGASQPDTVTFDLQVTVPPGTDLSAGKPILLGIRYLCDGTGGMADVTSPLDQSNAVSIDVHVLSGLQAFYSGSQFDFGEIGTLSTSQVLASPVRTDAANHFSVKSSGAFNVTLSSQKGFQLTNGGSAAGDKVDYQVKFLGAVLTKASAGPGATALNKDCAAVHVTSFSSLPIQATLLEGGQGKNPSGSYTDTLTVTLTPNAANFAGGDACTSYSVP